MQPFAVGLEAVGHHREHLGHLGEDSLDCPVEGSRGVPAGDTVQVGLVPNTAKSKSTHDEHNGKLA